MAMAEEALDLQNIQIAVQQKRGGGGAEGVGSIASGSRSR
jgi:hypothetical protein